MSSYSDTGDAFEAASRSFHAGEFDPAETAEKSTGETSRPSARQAFSAALHANFELPADSDDALASCQASKGRGSLRFRGVTKHKRTQRFEAHIWEAKKQIYLGGFDSETMAAKSHDIMALRCKGRGCEFLNFPLSCYTDLLHPLERMSRDEIVCALRNYSKAQSLRRSACGSPSTPRAGSSKQRRSATKRPASPGVRKLTVRTRVQRMLPPGSESMLDSPTHCNGRSPSCSGGDGGLPPTPTQSRRSGALPTTPPPVTPGASRAAARHWMAEHRGPPPSPFAAPARRRPAEAATWADVRAAQVACAPLGLRPIQTSYSAGLRAGVGLSCEAASGFDCLDLDSLLDVFVQGQQPPTQHSSASASDQTGLLLACPTGMGLEQATCAASHAGGMVPQGMVPRGMVPQAQPQAQAPYGMGALPLAGEPTAEMSREDSLMVWCSPFAQPEGLGFSEALGF